MDLDTDKATMRQEMLEEQRHEELMRYDEDYFCENTVNNFLLLADRTGYVDMRDIMKKLHEMCDKYDQDIGIVLDYMKEL